MHRALENPLTLLRTAVCFMDPMPGTDAAAGGARRHFSRNLEDGADRPNTCLVNAENGQILRLDAVHIRIVCNGEGATPQIINALRRNKTSVLSHANEITTTHVG